MIKSPMSSGTKFVPGTGHKNKSGPVESGIHMYMLPLYN
jgi:hypothetical protein